MIHHDIVRHLDGPAIRCRFRAPVTDHVIARVKRRGQAVPDTLDGADAEAGNIAGGDADGVADGFAGDRAGMIGTGAAIIVGAGAAGDEQTIR